MRDILGDRMKQHEGVWDHVLTNGLPVILRLDGNNFHRFTKEAKFEKPFDDRFFDCMAEAAKAVMDYCAGSVVAYTQSDEISILLYNTTPLETSSFLSNRVQKISSLCASVATVAFNRSLRALGVEQEAMFDCRVFILPEDEVNSYFHWRQADSFKNSISSFAYYEYSKQVGSKKAHKALDKLSTKERQEFIFQNLGVNPNHLPTHWKRGFCVYRKSEEVSVKDRMDPVKFERLKMSGHVSDNTTAVRSFWAIDREIPEFRKRPDFLSSLYHKDQSVAEVS